MGYAVKLQKKGSSGQPPIDFFCFNSVNSYFPEMSTIDSAGVSVIGSSTKYYMIPQCVSSGVVINGSTLPSSYYHYAGKNYNGFATGYWEFTLTPTDTVQLKAYNASNSYSVYASAIVVRCTNNEEIILDYNLQYTVTKANSNALFCSCSVPLYYAPSYLNGTSKDSNWINRDSNGYGIRYRYYKNLSSGDVITAPGNDTDWGKILVIQP